MGNTQSSPSTAPSPVSSPPAPPTSSTVTDSIDVTNAQSQPIARQRTPEEQSKRTRRQAGLFFGGVAFAAWSAYLTRRSLTRRRQPVQTAVSSIKHWQEVGRGKATAPTPTATASVAQQTQQVNQAQQVQKVQQTQQAQQAQQALQIQQVLQLLQAQKTPQTHQGEQTLEAQQAQQAQQALQTLQALQALQAIQGQQGQQQNSQDGSKQSSQDQSQRQEGSESAGAEDADAAAAAEEALKNSGPLLAVEALALATLNVISWGIMVTGGVLWWMDIASLDELRFKVRGGMGFDGTGRSEQDAEEELEEWIASVLDRKERKEEKKRRDGSEAVVTDSWGRQR